MPRPFTIRTHEQFCDRAIAVACCRRDHGAGRGDELRALAAQHGISDLRFASPGRLVGCVAEDWDALDTADFEIAARALRGADVGLFSDRVLGKSHVSPDLQAAHRCER